MSQKPKILRITTVSISLEKLIEGQIGFMESNGYEVHTASHGVYNGPRHTFIKDFTRTISPLKDLSALRELIELMQEIKPDIVHTHTPKAGLLGMMAARYCGIPIRMHTIGGLPLMEKGKLLRNFLKLIERATYSCATHVYCNSFKLKEYINRKILYRKKLKVIGNGTTNGINLNIFSPDAVEDSIVTWIRKEYQIDGSFIFVFVGRIVKDKGIIELVTAFESIATNSRSIRLLLVGNFEEDLDPLPLNIQETIKRHPQIINVGFQQDVRPFLKMSDVLVFPSYREGFPNVPLQAGAMRKAMILSDINGCSEIVEHNVSGVLVQPKDVYSLEKAMNEVLSNEHIAKRLSNAAYTSIRAKYDQQYVWSCLLDEYNNAVASL